MLPLAAKTCLYISIAARQHNKGLNVDLVQTILQRTSQNLVEIVFLGMVLGYVGIIGWILI
jgi:hypothetical protein